MNSSILVELKKIALLVFVLLLITSFVLTSIPVVQTDPASSIVELWSFEAGGDVVSVCSIPDVNGDGIHDVIAGSWDGKVYCLNGSSGELIWSQSTGRKVAVLPSHETENASNVVAAGAETCLLRGKNGSEIWRFSEGGASIFDGILIPDVDNDGIAEVVVHESNNIYLLSGVSGQVLWNFNTSQTIDSVAYVTNLNRKSNVVLKIRDPQYQSNGLWHIVSFNSTNGEELWSRPIYRPRRIVSATLKENVIADVVVGAVNGCYLLDGVDGRVIWSRKIFSPDPPAVWDLAVISDIDDDGVDDVVEGGWDNKMRVLSGADGTVLWVHALSLENGREYSPEAVISIQDLNQDGVPEVVAGTGRGLGYIHYFNGINGRLLGTYTLPNIGRQNDIWDLATISDVNGDGLDDVVAGSWDNRVYVLSAAFEKDTIKPTSYNDYDELWHNTDLTINLTATDFHSDVDETYYRINDGPIRSVSVDGHPLITTEGTNNTLEYWSVDNAGNEENHHILTDIKLDKTKPTVSAGQNQKVKVNTTITFDASSSTDDVSGIISYEWDFGDGQSSTEVIVNHTYSNLGEYTVILTVGDVAGNNATDSIVITVTGEDFSLLILGTAIGTTVIAIALGALYIRRRRTVKG